MVAEVWNLPNSIGSRFSLKRENRSVSGSFRERKIRIQCFCWKNRYTETILQEKLVGHTETRLRFKPRWAKLIDFSRLTATVRSFVIHVWSKYIAGFRIGEWIAYRIHGGVASIFHEYVAITIWQ